MCSMAPSSRGSSFAYDGVHHASQTQNEFFAKLAVFENALLRDQHPRYKLTKEEAGKLASSLNTPSFPSSFTPKNLSGNEKAKPLESHQASANRVMPSSSYASFAQPLPAPKPIHANNPSSTFDPVLLTKSDDLIKAELSLKRHRIERSLKDALLKPGKTSIRQNEFTADSPSSSLDAARIFDDATTLVKPVSGFVPAHINNSHFQPSSFHQNSTHTSNSLEWAPSLLNGSSRQDNRTQTIEHMSTNSQIWNDHAMVGVRDVGQNKVNSQNSQANSSLQADQMGNQVASLTEPGEIHEDSYSPEDNMSDIYEPPPPEHFAAFHSQTQSEESNHNFSNSISNQDRDSRESESYSPPPADQLPSLTALAENGREDGHDTGVTMTDRDQHAGMEDEMMTSSQQYSPTFGRGEQRESAQSNPPFGTSLELVNSAQQYSQRQEELENNRSNNALLGDQEGGHQLGSSDGGAQSDLIQNEHPSQAAVNSYAPVQPYVKAEALSPASAPQQPFQRMNGGNDARASSMYVQPNNNELLHGYVPASDNGRRTGDARSTMARPGGSTYDPIVVDDSEGAYNWARQYQPHYSLHYPPHYPPHYLPHHPPHRPSHHPPHFPLDYPTHYLPHHPAHYPAHHPPHYSLHYPPHSAQRASSINGTPRSNPYRGHPYLRSAPDQYQDTGYAHPGSRLSSVGPQSRNNGSETPTNVPRRSSTGNRQDLSLQEPTGLENMLRQNDPVEPAPTRRIIVDEDGNRYMAISETNPMFQTWGREQFEPYYFGPSPLFPPGFTQPYGFEHPEHFAQDPRMIGYGSEIHPDYLRMPPPSIAPRFPQRSRSVFNNGTGFVSPRVRSNRRGSRGNYRGNSRANSRGNSRGTSAQPQSHPHQVTSAQSPTGAAPSGVSEATASRMRASSARP